MATIDPSSSSYYSSNYGSIQNSTSQKRGIAMIFAMVTAIVLSPLYVNGGRQKDAYLETRLWNSGFVLPMVLGGLIVAIKTTSISSSYYYYNSSNDREDSSMRIGRSSWGLGVILGVMLFVVYWKDSVHHFLWR